MRIIAIIALMCCLIVSLTMLDGKVEACYVYKNSANKYKAQYDSLVKWEDDISNHIRKDFGIDTTSKTQYRQINARIPKRNGKDSK